MAPKRVVPKGWKIYHGTAVPFVIGYPSGWQVNEANAPVGEISFEQGGARSTVSGVIAARHTTGPLVSIYVQRDRLIRLVSGVCETGRRLGKSGVLTVSAIRFATGTATCATEEETGNSQDTRAGFFVGTAVLHGMTWTFTFRSPAEDLARSQVRYFLPMLRTLKIYGTNRRT